MHPMRRRAYRFTGALLVGAGVAGLVISLAGLAGVWRVERAMKTGLADALDLMDTTLQATADGLTVAGQSLDQADRSLDTLVDTIRTTGKTISDTIPLLASLTQVATQDVPTTVLATQGALASAQSSAQIVDTTLSLLTSIPFLPIAPYQPSVPLSQALADVSASLDAIPKALSSMQVPLMTTTSNLVTIQAHLAAIARDIEGIGASLDAARAVISDYVQVITTLKQQTALVRVSLPRRLDTIAWFVSILLIWLALTQVGLMLQGFETLRPDYMQQYEQPPERTAPAEAEAEPAAPAEEAPSQAVTPEEQPPDAAPAEAQAADGQ